MSLTGRGRLPCDDVERRHWLGFPWGGSVAKHGERSAAGRNSKREINEKWLKSSVVLWEGGGGEKKTHTQNVNFNKTIQEKSHGPFRVRQAWV